MKILLILLLTISFSISGKAQKSTERSYESIKDSVQVLADLNCMLVKPSENPSKEELRYFTILTTLTNVPAKHLQTLIMEDDQFISLYGFVALCSSNVSKVKKKHKLIFDNEEPMYTCIIGKDNIDSSMTIGKFAQLIYRSKSRG